MIFDSVTLNNFGVYGGSQTVELSPVSEGKPIVLFGGMNGGGKTTLLDAIQLALYGDRARCSGRGKQRYREYLRDMIHRGVDPSEGASIDLRFNRFVDGRRRSYRLRRSWRDNGKGLVDNVDVLRDGEPDPLLSEHWDEHIESYIPHGIAHLFFFDAEQIKELANGEHAAEILRTAVNTLLGLDLVDRLQTDLVALKRRKQKELQSAKEAKKTNELEADRDRIQELIDRSTSDLGDLGEEIGRQKKDLEEVRAKFRSKGGELFLKREELDGEKEELVDRLKVEEDRLRTIAAGVAPLLMIPELLESTLSQARTEAQTHRSEVLVEALDERDAGLLKELARIKVPKKHRDAIAELMDEYRERQRESARRPCYLDGDDHLPHELGHLIASSLPAIREEISRVLEKSEGLSERITRLDRQLAQVPDSDAIGAIQLDLTRRENKLQAKQSEQRAQEDKISLLHRQLEEVNRRIGKELTKLTESGIDRKHDKRVIEHSEKVRSTLDTFRAAIMRKQSERLEQLVLDSFTQLLRKTHLVTGLSIDPESFRIELRGADGEPLPFDRLSAGERQLLATSILWGLARASGRPLPTIIDTPLGRLDSSHRKHLVERYFPVASHQVILLSTDEEIDEVNHRRLKRYVGRSYELAFDEKSRQTQIQQGYFWKS